MSKVIGIEQSLSNVEDALKAQGYNVIQLRGEQDAKKCDACIITGQDRDVMGISTPVIEGPVIEANGLTAEEIVQRVDKYFH